MKPLFLVLEWCSSDTLLVAASMVMLLPASSFVGCGGVDHVMLDGGGAVPEPTFRRLACDIADRVLEAIGERDVIARRQAQGPGSLRVQGSRAQVVTRL